MNPWETFGIFACIPAGVVALVVLAVYGRSMVRQPNRYRPGRSWDFAPAWYVPHPDALLTRPASGGPTTAVGGASGEW